MDLQVIIIDCLYYLFVYYCTDYDHSVSNGNHSVHLVKALYDYDPKTQSPNEDFQEELSFTSGDYITVYGDPVDGFYEVGVVIINEY